MGKAGDLKSEYVVHFIAPYQDRERGEVALEDHTYLVTMTSEQAAQAANHLQRMFDAGVIVQHFSVSLAELIRITPVDLNHRIQYFKSRPT